MSRRCEPLRAEDVARLPGQCSGCLHWEQAVDSTSLPDLASPAVDIRRHKTRWWTEALASGRVAGVVLREDGTGSEQPQGDRPAIIGYATYRIPARSQGDALTILGLHVALERRADGIGRSLVLAVARQALLRPRVRAVEATAGLPFSMPGRWRPRCVAPLDFWLGCGFTVVQPHPLTPRVRLDARVLATWRTGLSAAAETAWERVRGTVSPQPVPGQALSRDQALRRDQAVGRDQSLRKGLSSASRADLGRAPTMDFTTSPPW